MSSSVATKSDSIDVLVSPPTATISASPIPQLFVRLDGTNFLLWRTLILPTLSGLNLHGYLDVSIPALEKTSTEGEGAAARVVSNSAYQIWWQQDQCVLGALLTSMTPDMATQMVGLTTASQVWAVVHGMFVAQNRATIRHTRLQLQTLRKGDLPAAEYFQKIKSLADTMATIGNPLTDDELIDYILGGLGPQFGPLVASITLANISVTLTDFYAFLLSFESLQEQQQQTGDWSISPNSAARVSDPDGRSSRRFQPGRDRGNQQPRSGGHRNPKHDGGAVTGNRGGGSQSRTGPDGYRPNCEICRIF